MRREQRAAKDCLKKVDDAHRRSKNIYATEDDNDQTPHDEGIADADDDKCDRKESIPEPLYWQGWMVEVWGRGSMHLLLASL